MIGLFTPEEAAAKTCPIGRTQPMKNAVVMCRGTDCMFWRIKARDTSEPGWKEAVRKVADESGEKAPYAKSSRTVANDPEAHGMGPQRGYCGLAGEPKA